MLLTCSNPISTVNKTTQKNICTVSYKIWGVTSDTTTIQYTQNGSTKTVIQPVGTLDFNIIFDEQPNQLATITIIKAASISYYSDNNASFLDGKVTKTSGPSFKTIVSAQDFIKNIATGSVAEIYSSDGLDVDNQVMCYNNAAFTLSLGENYELYRRTEINMRITLNERVAAGPLFFQVYQNNEAKNTITPNAINYNFSTYSFESFVFQ